MTTVRHWLKGVTLDAAIAYLFYIWQFKGVEQAGNVVVFALWVLAVIYVLCGMACDKSDFQNNPRPPGFKSYRTCVHGAFVIALVWFNHLWLPAIYLMGCVMLAAAREREPEVEK